MSLFAELKRRNVLRIGAAYLVAAWLLVQVSATLFPLFDFSPAAVRITVILFAIGFIPALILAWVFEITPEGLKRESEIDRDRSTTPGAGKKLDRIIMVVLAAALGYFAFDKFVLAPAREESSLASARQEGRSEALVESYGEKSIAVLPFVNMSNDPEQEYFSDGISEELLNLLAKIPELRVISRSSSFSYKGKDIKLSQVAKELNVVHILEGSVRKAGNKIRITAQLIEARSDTHLWSQTWDRELTDIFAVQDEIASAVVGLLKITLLRDVPKVKEVNPEAYALFLKAREISRQGTDEAFEQSIALFQQALAADPNDAAAWVSLASIYATQANKGLRPIDESYQLAREAVNRALAVDPDFAVAHALLGRIASDYDGDLAKAAGHIEKALELDPTNLAVINYAADLAQGLGRLEQALVLNQYVVARDPMSPSAHGSMGYDYVRLGHLDEGIASYRTALSLSPGRVGTQYNIGEALLRKGELDAAMSAMQQESSENWRLMGLPLVYHAQGRKAESDSALAELIDKHERDSAYNIAYVFAFRGEFDSAFEWLDKAVAYHDTGLVEIMTDPMFANLHDDPRWLPFLQSLGKAPEQMAAIKFEVTLPE